MPKCRQPRSHAAGIALYNFAGVALFPRWFTLFYPPLFRSPTGVALHISYRVLFTFAMLRWVVPKFRATAEERQRVVDELTAQLGREPTGEEIMDEVVRRGSDD